MSDPNPTPQPVTPSAPQRRRWPWVLLGFVALLGAALYVWSWYLKQPWHLPPFDRAKAAQLSPQQRADYEKELFSELMHWFRPTQRYPTWEPNFYLAREQRWLEMANDGFELAHIVLQVVQPSTGHRFNLKPPFRRLVQLAEQGDQGAMCLMPGLVLISSSERSDPKVEAIARDWMVKGAELGHPQCLRNLGGRLMYGSDEQPKDPDRGKALIFESIRKGYVHDLGVLALHYERQGLGDLNNLKASYCWESQDKNRGIGDHLSDTAQKRMAVAIQLKVPATQQEAAMKALSAMADWSPSAEECIELSEDN